MSVTVTVTKELDSLWASSEQFKNMTDEQIVALVREDLSEFVDRATWEVRRARR